MTEYLVFSTVGTSVNKDNRLGGNYGDDSFFDNWKYSKDDFETDKVNLLAKIDFSDDNFCAEIRSLTKLYEKLQSEEGNVSLDVHLLCTDTIISPVCAWCIQEWFKENKKYANIAIYFDFNKDYVVENLRVTNSQEQMEKGFLRFVESLKTKATKIEVETKPNGAFQSESVENNVIINSSYAT